LLIIIEADAALDHGPHTRARENRVAPFGEALRDARTEEAVLGKLGAVPAHRLGELRALGHEDEAGLRAELTRRTRDAREEAARDLVAALGDGLSGDEHRVHAAELAVERDRGGPRGGDIGEESTDVDRARERTGLDPRILQHRDPGLLTMD